MLNSSAAWYFWFRRNPNTVQSQARHYYSFHQFKIFSNNTLTKDSYSESAIHKLSAGKTPIFFLRANNSLRFSIRIFSLFHTSITSASLILPYYNSVSIFFYSFSSCFLPSWSSKYFITPLWFPHLMWKNVPSFPHLESYHSLERSIKKVITSADIFADQYHRFSELWYS